MFFFFLQSTNENALQIPNCKRSPAWGDAAGWGRDRSVPRKRSLSFLHVARLYLALPRKASFRRRGACSERLFWHRFYLVARQKLRVRRTRFEVRSREEGFPEGFLFEEGLKSLAHHPPPRIHSRTGVLRGSFPIFTWIWCFNYFNL